MLFIDGFGLATVTNVCYRYQPGEVTRSQQEVLHLVVGPIELHCNRYDTIVATTGRHCRIPGFDNAWMIATHSGVTLGPLLGRLIADEILRDTPSATLAPFRPDRFAAAATR